jgi:hypothetical protein
MVCREHCMNHVVMIGDVLLLRKYERFIQCVSADVGILCK